MVHYPFTDRRVVKKGFTLIEPLLALAIAGVLLGALSGFFVLSLQSRAKQHVITEVEQQGAAAMEAMISLVRSATSMTLPAAGSSGSTLILAMVDALQNPTRVELSNGRLWLTQGSGATQALTSSRVVVSNIQFERLAAPTVPGGVRIIMTLAAYNPQNRHEYAYSQPFTTTISLRR